MPTITLKALFHRRPGLLLLLALSLPVILSCKKKESPCNEEHLEAILKLGDDVIQKHGLLGLGEECQFPKALDDLLMGLRHYPPESSRLLVDKAIVDDISLIERACPGSAQILIKIIEAPPEEKTQIFVDSCGLEKLGLATREELLRQDITRLKVVVMVYAFMKEKEVKLARLLCRRILGLK